MFQTKTDYIINWECFPSKPHKVKLDLDALESYAVYSGLFCAITGTNPNGKVFVAEKIQTFEFDPLQFFDENHEVPKERTDQLQNTGEWFSTVA